MQTENLKFSCAVHRMKIIRSILLITFVSLLPSQLFAQPIRFELGQRTRALEFAWDAQPDVEARKRATINIKQAVTLFFALKLNEAAKNLDQARFALQSATPPSSEAQWAESLFVLPEARLIDKTATTLGFTVDKFYSTTAEIPKGAIMKLGISNAGKIKIIDFPITNLPIQAQLPLAFLKVTDGDFALTAKIVVGGKMLTSSEQTISVVANLSPRIAALKQVTENSDPKNTDGETAKLITGLLANLEQKKTLETNLPAARLLAETENVLKAQAAKQSFYGNSKSGQYWLSLATAGTPIPVRMLAPAAVKQKKALPLVIALHGAGGSENMFFDTYGHGMITQLCEQRGWLLVSPRGTGMKPERVAEIIEAVAKLYPVDLKRVFVVGHSMGAGQTAAASNLMPEKFAAVAALGGGQAIKTPSEGVKKLPFFVGAGSEDFGLRGAKALNESLQQAEVKKNIFREYAGIEHLTIVQVALKDVFTFFDSVR